MQKFDGVDYREIDGLFSEEELAIRRRPPVRHGPRDAGHRAPIATAPSRWI
jgi:hypothetical protein